MRQVHQRCCGLDVHKKTVVACVITPRRQETRTFGTMTRDLLTLSDWLVAEGVTHVAMESTGVYWKSVYNLLEATDLQLLVVNARHVKAVPGRKTDVRDAEWLADLLRHGLLRASFIPDRAQRELRELVRYRKTLTEDRARLVTRIQKVLEGANIKLSDVASDVMGMSARAMLKELAAGNTNAEAMAELALSNLRSKRPQLEQALVGSVGSHQRFMLSTQIRLVESMEQELALLDHEVEERLRPFEAALALIDEIPGVGRRTAEIVLVEIGPDMSRFPTADHLASWARICPGTNMSAGKRGNASIGPGSPWLRGALMEASLGALRADRAKPNFLAARIGALPLDVAPSERGPAAAHSILIAIYHMLRDGAHYQDLGATHWDEHHRAAIVKRSVRRLEQLGYQVTLDAGAA